MSRLSPAMQMIGSLPDELQGMGKELFATNLPAFYKLVNEHALKRPDLQKNFDFANKQSPEMREAILRSQLKEGLAPGSYITADGKTQMFSPAAGMPGGLAPKAGAPIRDAETWAKANNIVISRNGGNRTFEGQLDQYIQNPSVAALPGTSAHERGRAIDVPEASRTPEVLAKLKAAGFENVGKSPWHFELPKNAALPAAAAPRPSGVGTTVQDIALQEKALELSNRTFHESVFKPILDRAGTASDIETLSNQVLANIEGNDFGPGTELEQSFKKYAQLVGFPLSEKEMQKFVDNKGIETARKFLSAKGARQAMGAQFTAQESADWFKAFAGIDDQKQYLKNFYQMQRAGALVDKDVADYLLQNQGREYQALNEWKASGRKDRIMQENVDAFKNGKPTKVNVSGDKPAKEKTVKRTGMVTDTKNPNYGKQAIEYNDGSMEYKSLENK